MLQRFENLENYFDYIIIGGQTPNFDWMRASPGCPFSQPIWANFFLNSTVPNYEFKLYSCDNKDDEIFQEILEFASFNNKPRNGDFCYTNAEKLYWHKKEKEAL